MSLLYIYILSRRWSAFFSAEHLEIQSSTFNFCELLQRKNKMVEPYNCLVLCFSYSLNMTPGKTASNGLNEASLATTSITMPSDVSRTTNSAAMTECSTTDTTRHKNNTISNDSVTIDTMEEKPIGTDCNSIQFKTQKSTEEKIKIEVCFPGFHF